MNLKLLLLSLKIILENMKYNIGKNKEKRKIFLLMNVLKSLIV